MKEAGKVSRAPENLTLRPFLVLPSLTIGDFLPAALSTRHLVEMAAEEDGGSGEPHQHRCGGSTVAHQRGLRRS